MLNNLTDKFAYKFDECELFINGKKFNLDWEFEYTLKEKEEPLCILKLINSSPKISEIIIRVNQLSLFIGKPNESLLDCYNLKTNQLTKEFSVKLVEQLSDGDDCKEQGNLWKAGTYLSNYFKTNYDFKLQNDMYFSGESIANRLFKVVKDNKESENYTLTGRNINFGHVEPIKKITKIIDKVESTEGSLTLVCKHNPRIFPSISINIDKKTYVLYEVQHKFSTKDGYLMSIFGKNHGLLKIEGKRNSTIDSTYE